MGEDPEPCLGGDGGCGGKRAEEEPRGANEGAGANEGRKDGRGGRRGEERERKRSQNLKRKTQNHVLVVSVVVEERGRKRSQEVQMKEQVQMKEEVEAILRSLPTEDIIELRSMVQAKVNKRKEE